ncbi:MAG: YfhO family protein, partial [Verrucomicrobiota bacterium]
AIVPYAAEEPGPHMLVQVDEGRKHRYRMVYDWEVVETAAALERIQSEDFVPLKKVLVEESPMDPPGAAGTWKVETVEKRDNRVRLKVSTDQPGLLRVADKYHDYWKASVNGEEVPVVKCDYLFRAIPVDAGEHEIVMAFKPPRTWLDVQCAGFLVCLLGLVSLKPFKNQR